MSESGFSGLKNLQDFRWLRVPQPPSALFNIVLHPKLAPVAEVLEATSCESQNSENPDSDSVKDY